MPGALFDFLPFAVLLLALAVAPLWFPERWTRNRTKAALVAALGVPTVARLAFMGAGRGGLEVLEEAAREYVSFVAYLGSLYVVASGVTLRGSLEASPLKNALYLVLGGVLASLVGTAGASLLLIGPLIAANRRREDRALPIVFFIFVVANGGGLLTPLGDPPLYLGFIRGVPFLWTIVHLFPVWATYVLSVSAIYFVVATVRDRRRVPGPAAAGERGPGEPLRLEGWPNLVLLALLVAASFLSGKLDAWWVSPLAFVALAGASLVATPPLRRLDFSWHPLIEVALVFAGVFATLAPVTSFLRAQGPALPLASPLAYFFTGGALSSVLDNAPTYLVLLEGAARANASLAHPLAGVGATGVPADVLAALSAGCVLFGANTYIGNGPNLLVRSLAEREGVPMPGFFKYAGVALVVLGPVYVLLALLYFR